MARTEQISRACEQLHPTVSLLDKAHVLQEFNASSVIYGKNIYEKYDAYSCRVALLFQLGLLFSRIISLNVY